MNLAAEYGMLKIQSYEAGERRVLALSGRIEAENLAQLRALSEAETGNVMLDLAEVDLVSREAVLFLERCEARGIQLKNCPPYVREWIARERGRQKD